MRTTLAFLTCLLFLAGTPKVQAQAGGGTITLSTTLLTVEPRQRTATVSVANRTATVQRYRVSVVDMVMEPNGQVFAPGEDVAVDNRSAKSWVIATPRSLNLGPGRSQTIRLLFRRPGNIRDGEYRAHLKVAQEPPADSAGGLNETQQDGGMQINIVTVYATSIPIVFKQGQLSVSASIADARLIDPENLSLTVERKGNASFRGFARATVGNSSQVNMPITIYPECDQVTRTYKLGALAGTTGPLTLTLHEGLIPHEGEEVPSEAITTFTVAR